MFAESKVYYGHLELFKIRSPNWDAPPDDGDPETKVWGGRKFDNYSMQYRSNLWNSYSEWK